jgi:hypothetical protein
MVYQSSKPLFRGFLSDFLEILCVYVTFGVDYEYITNFEIKKFF